MSLPLLLSLLVKNGVLGTLLGPPNTPKLSQKPYKVTPKSKKVLFLNGSLFSRFCCRNARPVFTIFGSPRDPQICTNTGLSRTFGSHDSYFLDFCCERCYNQLFHQNLIDFRPQNHCVFHWFFAGFLVFLWTWRPSQNIVIYVSKHTFSFSKIL